MFEIEKIKIKIKRTYQVAGSDIQKVERLRLCARDSRFIDHAKDERFREWVHSWIDSWVGFSLKRRDKRVSSFRVGAAASLSGLEVRNTYHTW